MNETSLAATAAYHLRGILAAPFACRTTAPPAAEKAASPARAAAPAQAVSTPGAAGSPIGRPVVYSVTDLNPLTSTQYVYALGINTGGQVVGEFQAANGESHAFFYDGRRMRDLGTLGGHQSSASGINQAGTVVGYSLTGEVDDFGFVSRAFSFDGRSIAAFGKAGSWANKISDRGQAVGSMYVPVENSNEPRAAIWSRGAVRLLGTLGGASSGANSINRAGEIVGSSAAFVAGTRTPATRGFVYQGGVMRDLGSLGYLCRTYPGGYQECDEQSEAADINDRGEIAGFSTTHAGPVHAFLGKRTALRDLGTLGGSQSWARAVNDSGQTVGSSLTAKDTAYHGFIYEDGRTRDLNERVADRPPGFLMGDATDINNFGQIVGTHYLLQPRYDSVDGKKQMSFTDTLRRRLSFEYWVAAPGSSGCAGQVRPEVRFGGAGTGAQTPASGATAPWRPAAQAVSACRRFERWRPVSLTVPTALAGHSASVQIRAGISGTGGKPVIYLRRFKTE